MPARVIILAPVHDYDDVRVFQKEAKTLAAAGYEVRLLARAERALEEDGVRVVPLPRPASRLVRFARLPGVLRRALRERGDVYHLHNPDTLPLALALRLLGKRVVYDTHEDFSRRLHARRWIPRPLRPLLARAVAAAEGAVARRVDLAVGTQPAVRDRLGPRALLLGNPPIVSGPLIDEAHAQAAGIERTPGPFRLVYAGRITRPRGLFTMLDALALANAEHPVRLWLIGPFNEGDQPAAERHPAWRFVDYLGVLPQARAFAHLARADAGLVTILDVGDHRDTSPNKLFEYQVFGLPFVASDFPAWRAQMADVEAGVFVDPADPAAVAAEILRLARDPGLRERMGEAGRAFVARYNWEGESRKLLAAYAALLPPADAPEGAAPGASRDLPDSST